MSSVATRTGQVIFLNGTSSSGKSAIAAQLLLVLDRPFFHMAVDAINGMRAREHTLGLEPGELAAVLARTRAGFHRAVAGMAQAGNDIVVDYVLSERWRLLDCLTVLDGLDVVFVGVRCSEQELARREEARGDRQPGQAAAQFRQVHSYGRYDIECDTTTATPRDCALTIKQSLDQLPEPRAFERLRSALQDLPEPTYGRRSDRTAAELGVRPLHGPAFAVRLPPSGDRGRRDRVGAYGGRGGAG
ncbi:MAG TPA: AAA family ATPase [Trebonia sp.]|nr:AAA family ATPase [Trebonia sp.]